MLFISYFPAFPSELPNQSLRAGGSHPENFHGSAAVLNETCSDAAAFTSDTCRHYLSTSDLYAPGTRFNDLTNVTRPTKEWRLEVTDDKTTGKTCGTFYMQQLMAEQLQVTRAVAIYENRQYVLNG